MKKLLIGMVSLLVATIMFGCAKEEKETVIYNGVVGEVRDGEFEFEYDNNGTVDNMIVITDEKVEEGEFVQVEAEPIVMLSEPARVNALSITKVESYNMPLKKLYCHLLEFDDDNNLIVGAIVGANEVTEGDMVLTYKVDCSEVQAIPRVSAGTKLVIEYDGTMTKSIQPTLVAKSIEVSFPER